MGAITLHLGDITTDADADALVNAANSSLLGGGGVDGAIHRAAGPALLEECRAIGGCPPGEVRVTGAGRLAARCVIHAVGPVWAGGERGERELLGSCYSAAIEAAARHGCATVALPAISTGAYGYPLDLAAEVAVGSVRMAMREHGVVREARFWLFDQSAHVAFAAALEALR
ncbi:MAG TPA: O-acetyl-ADP-ribose deacetylase [Solirubrobacteraceae bacterium]|jgi:O-acetyl-ADP-ribose deacetylase (regulator of RNase III)